VVSRAALAVLALASACALAQEAPRIALGGGYSVAAPAGEGWIAEGKGAQRSFRRVLGPDSHTLVMLTAAGPSGITREQVEAIANADKNEAANLLIRTLGTFTRAAWKMNSAGVEAARYTVLSKDETVDSKFAGGLICSATRIRARDRGPDGYAGEPLILRYVGYTCVDVGRLMESVHVSYSERAAEADLSDAALEAGEAFARSLRRD
jgi:hypothetical protein